MTWEERIGTVTHYYPKAHAAAVELDRGTLHVGDTIHILGPGVDRRERVTSLQIDHTPVDEASAGENVGILVRDFVPRRAEVFLVRERAGFWRRLFGR